MQASFPKKLKVTTFLLVASSLISLPAFAELALPDMPPACLPHRAKVDQQEPCHCPPAELCENASGIPSLIYNICCDDNPSSSSGGGGTTSGGGSSSGGEDSGICTENGCSTGWHKVWVKLPGYNAPAPEYYCDEEPDCSKEVLFGHFSPGIKSQIIEYNYNYPDRVAVQTTLNVYQENGTITPTPGWICNAHGMSPSWNQGQPLAIISQFWITGLLAGDVGGMENICVNTGFPDANCFNKIANSHSDIGACMPGEDCLPADTQVILEDGKKLLITEVKVGDKLQSQTSVNTVEEVLVYKTKSRQLYVINNGEFTITEGHPVLTQKGWATAGEARTATKVDEKNWSDHPLRVGDIIVGKEGATRITHIAPLDIPDVETYNLKLSGDNTFIANGVVVQGFTTLDVGYDKEPDGKK